MRALLKEILENPRAMVYAILVHVALAAVLFISLEWTDVATPKQPKVDVVQAVAVDEKKIQAELDKLKKAEEKKRKAEERKQKQLDKKAKDAEKKRKAEEQRLAKLKKEREAEKRKKEAEAKQLAEEQAKKQREVERLAAEKATLEKQRLAEELRLAEMEAKRQEEAERKRQEALAEAERQRKAEEERKRSAEIAAEQARLEAERQKHLATLKGQYIADITNKVERNWIKPPTAKQGLSCKVEVNQIPGGEVINVKVTQCIGDDIFRRSVERAVYKASPLPSPPDPDLFDRDLVFTFKPKQ